MSQSCFVFFQKARCWTRCMTCTVASSWATMWSRAALIVTASQVSIWNKVHLWPSTMFFLASYKLQSCFNLILWMCYHVWSSHRFSGGGLAGVHAAGSYPCGGCDAGLGPVGGGFPANCWSEECGGTSHCRPQRAIHGWLHCSVQLCM